MDYVHFINLEYFILLAYRVFTGTNIDISQIPAQTLQLTEYIGWAGIILTVVFAWLFFNARQRMHAVEHEGWHKRAGEEEHVKVSHTSEVPINPQWERIQTLISSPNESEWRRAIMEADIMMGGMLTARGFRGNTIADQLRDANPIQFTTLDLAWKAHKVRNEIAHQGESFTLDERTAHATIDLYRQVFEEFAYL
ncbi:MAG TPA: hypothetical protein VMR46_03990 [Candidatus Paceibacterota bacterium]|jgi:hypothetical protein|nr:hypothetical protein [Candidatus Paceibacterota bacterium]